MKGDLMRKEKYITERKRGKYTIFEVNFWYFDQNYNKVLYSKTFNSKHYATLKECLEEAIKDRNEARYKLDTKGLKRSTEKTVKECYEEAKELFQLSYQTDRKQDLYFNKCVKPYEDVLISKITAKDIAMSLNTVKDKAQDSIDRCFTVWKRIIRCALINDYIMSDPTIKVKAPKSEAIITRKPVEMSCSLEQVIEAINNYGVSTAEGRFNARILALAVMTINYLGLRPSECYAIKKDDIDFNNMTVRINKAVGSKHNVKTAVKTTKTQKSNRVLPISSALLPYLKEVMEIQDSDYLFAKYDGSLMYANYASGRIRLSCKKAGIDFRMYMLRHKFSTDLITNGVDIRTVMELMGHSSPNMSIDYARSNTELKNHAVNIIANSSEKSEKNPKVNTEERVLYKGKENIKY